MTALLEPAAGRASAELEATGRIPGLRPVTALPRPRPAATGTAPAVTGTAPAVTGAAPAVTGAAPATAPAQAAPPAAPPETGTADARRSVRRPPGRRGPLWLGALVAGALVAAVPGFTTDGSGPVPTSAADYGLGAEFGFAGDMEDAGVRRGITEAEAAVRLSELAASRAAREPETVDPVPGARMTTCFCMRWGSMHYGLDLAAPLGTPIYSVTDGVVLRAGRASGYGNAVYVQDADGNVHVYGHMRYYDVEEGQIVHAGDQIAQVGNEGQSTGPHLHYQIHGGGPSGRPIDPEEFLAERGVPI